MEILKLNTSVQTTEPAVALDPALAPGSYRVTLVASGSRGDSLPAALDFVIVRRTRAARVPRRKPAPT